MQAIFALCWGAATTAYSPQLTLPAGARHCTHVRMELSSYRKSQFASLRDELAASARDAVASVVAAENGALVLDLARSEATNAELQAELAESKACIAALVSDLALARGDAQAVSRTAESTTRAAEAAAVQLERTAAVLEAEHVARVESEELVASLSARRPQPPSASSNERLRNSFSSYDRDGNGSLDAAELLELFVSLGYDFNRADIESVMSTHDVNNDGVINFEEFSAMFAAMP
ncbi:hypothetical protein T492DRAFT_1052898 [Pavlovales sp. CCMP2436]|nr:hypothetical protein T492DRAFT_1052898 [Pavlovales sp. CCMP2436]|mmetsp:Transcript_9667/g.24340  ORF Transcript_9667/g.24340 Transcript_9667/m.24340 type:complete len:235 (-) Transcript_9667:368-1072(-)